MVPRRCDQQPVLTATESTEGWRAEFSMLTPIVERVPPRPWGPRPMESMAAWRSSSSRATFGLVARESTGRMRASLDM